MGYESKVVVDIYRRQVCPGDTYLICSDGLSGLVDMAAMLETLQKLGLEKGLKQLVKLANDSGGDDNISAVACQVLGN